VRERRPVIPAWFETFPSFGGEKSAPKNKKPTCQGFWRWG